MPGGVVTWPVYHGFSLGERGLYFRVDLEQYKQLILVRFEHGKKCLPHIRPYECRFECQEKHHLQLF